MRETLIAPDGQPLHYEIRGDGEPVVFVHGWAMGIRCFARQLQDLSDRLTVIVPALRGMGDSAPLMSDPTRVGLETYADDLDFLITHEGLDDVMLVGWSFGAYVLGSYVQKYGTARLRACGIIEMAAHPGDPDPSWADVENDAISRGFPAYLRAFIPSMFERAQPPELLQQLYDESVKTSPELARHLNTVMAHADFRRVLPHLDVPTLLVHGGHPMFFSREDMGRTARGIARCTVRCFPESRHCPFLEEADAFNDALAAFLCEARTP